MNDDDVSETLFPEPEPGPNPGETVWPDHGRLARYYKLDEETVARLLRFVYNATGAFGVALATVDETGAAEGGLVARLYGKRCYFALAVVGYAVRLDARSLDDASGVSTRLFSGRDTAEAWSKALRRLAAAEGARYADVWGSGDDEGDAA
jgi:hypothetical protein